MPYKNLEHDGGDVFSSLNREETNKTKKEREELAEEQIEKHKEIAQEAYMDMENPVLWDGEI